ncbi:MAG: type I glyceraldehyde-3-phosphate dehydrogenase [Candidatus Thorarchaeota archaeon SMTZ1-45]|nr:MAG: glyceraldehyde-3-phosphate dehydrogenase [Candidatus Thorarchaeota archaeon SMTZ1-45]
MAIRVGINGFGRIGRGFLRAALEKKGFDIVAANDLTTEVTLAHLMKYDTVMGHFEGTVEAGKGSITVNGDEIKILSERDPVNLPWGDLGVDIVIESTGIFRKLEDVSKHLAAGAKKVILSAPGKGGEMLTVVPGVNDDDYDSSKHHVISNASCTTNCLAPMVKVLDEAFGIEKGFMTTIHAVTNDQVMLDGPHKDLRRARAACWNIVPTSTGAASAIGLVYPKAAGKLDGMALRVPVMDASLVDMSVILQKTADVDAVNNAFKKAAESGDLAPYLAYIDEPLVSSDFIGDPHSCSFDSMLTMAHSGMVKVFGWYDNEAGYSHRLADLAAVIGRKL